MPVPPRSPVPFPASFFEAEMATSVEQIVSRPVVRAECARCGEEIINEREIWRAGLCLCRACAGEAYYVPVHPSPLEAQMLLGHGNIPACMEPKP